MENKCSWTVDKYDYSSWETSCDNRFVIMEGKPGDKDHRFKFCPYCGKKLRVGTGGWDKKESYRQWIIIDGDHHEVVNGDYIARIDGVYMLCNNSVKNTSYYPRQISEKDIEGIELKRLKKVMRPLRRTALSVSKSLKQDMLGLFRPDKSSPILYTNMECWDFDNEKNFHDGLD